MSLNVDPALADSYEALKDSFYKVDCGPAHEAGDALAIWSDLAYSAGAFQRLHPLLNAKSRDLIVTRALYIGGIAFYGRCFVEGRRYWLRPTIFDGRYPLPPGAVEQHQLLMNLVTLDLRHPVSGFEQMPVGVFVVIEASRPRIVGDGSLHARHHLRTVEGVDKARRHIEALRDYVQKVAGQLQGEVARIARTVPIEEIIRPGPYVLAAPEIDDAAKGRRGPIVTSIPGLD